MMVIKKETTCSRQIW